MLHGGECRKSRDTRMLFDVSEMILHRACPLTGSLVTRHGCLGTEPTWRSKDIRAGHLLCGQSKGLVQGVSMLHFKREMLILRPQLESGVHKSTRSRVPMRQQTLGS